VSKTVAVTNGEVSFWAYDLALGIWLKLFCDEVRSQGWAGPGATFESDVREWELTAVLGANRGLDLAREWTIEKRLMFDEAARRVQQALAAGDHLGSDEINSWRLLDGQPIARAGTLGGRLQAEPILDLGEALMGLVAGNLASAPPGTWWMIGYSPERTTIEMRG